MSPLPGPTDPGTPEEGSTPVRRVPRAPGGQLDPRLGHRPLTEAEAVSEERRLAAELEEAGWELDSADPGVGS